MSTPFRISNLPASPTRTCDPSRTQPRLRFAGGGVFQVQAMAIYHLDYETTSKCDIKLGAYRYACDPSTRILLFAIAKDDSDPLVWRFDEPESRESLAAVAMIVEAIESGSLIYAHNAQFELAISQQRLLPDLGIDVQPDINNWRCTQAMCRRAAIPESLGKAAAFLKLPDQKETVGKALIKIFSNLEKLVTLEPPVGMIDPDSQKVMRNGSLTKGKKPKNRKSASPVQDEVTLWDWTVKVAGQKMTVRTAWDLFISYCRQDVKVEKQVHRMLTDRFELTGAELESFQMDMRTNHRGVPMNLTALENAQKLIDEFQGKVEKRMLNMCGLRSSQGKKLIVWLRDRGYKQDNLQSETVEKALNKPGDLTPLALEVLKCRALLSFAALAKVKTFRAASCPDGRVRGTSLWHGARTGRDTGRITQFQNVKKSTISDSDVAYDMICRGIDLPTMEAMWESPMETIASCTRHFVQLPDGKMMFDGDFVGVEGRLTPWLAGDEKKLQSILDGVDPYKAIASKLFNVPYDEVTKYQRTIAKPVELGCCFGVGGKGLMESLANPPYNIQRSRAECNNYVSIYRDAHQPTVKSWKEIEDAAKAAIRTGQVYKACNGKLAFGKVHTAGIDFLVMKLPSGRKMYYPNPTIKEVFKKYDEEDMQESAWKREKGGYWIDSISFYGKVEGVWCRIHTWGSRLFENAVQAMGADLLNYGCLQLERQGFKVVLRVHDQVIAENDGQSVEDFNRIFCSKEPWAECFPLEADSNVVNYYLKD